MRSTIFLLALALPACATLEGVQFSDEERARCAESKDCTVWTQAELKTVVEHYVKQAYMTGHTAGAMTCGRGS